MISNKRCEELERLEREAGRAYLEARKIRRSRDVSIHEDSQLAREVRGKIDAVILHLLAGHGDLPCPCGERPIISPRGATFEELNNRAEP
ncbi:MAG TPA: hypothetical protein VEU52_03625 [Candidatus Limnocylindrales bacterium]|nr:hypothetical protein [Candidatus Limnocylindrales bacterium]